jgi:hypothetical protein
MFPDNCRLPHLRKLTLGLVMANSGWAAQRLAKCCKGVTYLALLDIDAGREVSPAGEPSTRSHVVSLRNSQYGNGVACHAAAGLFPLAVDQLVWVFQQRPCWTFASCCCVRCNASEGRHLTGLL